MMEKHSNKSFELGREFRAWACTVAKNVTMAHLCKENAIALR